MFDRFWGYPTNRSYARCLATDGAQAEAISGETIPQGNHVSSGVEYEAVWAFGANCDDSAGLCVFLAFACLDEPESNAAIPEMISALYGTELDVCRLMSFGDDILAVERDFNRRAGLTPRRPPARLLQHGGAYSIQYGLGRIR